MEKNIMSRKSVEAFVPWKAQKPSEGRQPSAGATASTSSGKGMKKLKNNVAKSVCVPPNPESGELEGRRAIRGFSKTRGSGGRQSQQVGSSGSREQSDEAIVAGRNEGHVMSSGGRKVDSSVQKRASSNPSSGHHRAVVSPGRSHVPSGSGNAVKTVAVENERAHAGRPKSSSMMISKDVHCHNAGEYPPRGQVRSDAMRNLSSSRGIESRDVHRSKRCRSSARQEVEFNGLEDEENDLQPDSVDCVEEVQQKAIVSDSDEVDDIVVEDSEEEREAVDKVHDESPEDENYVMDVHAMTVADESRRRRESRQAQSIRDREGDRRIKEGLPRNFLLVDEYTRKPYGVGVGAWRKELMLLSRDLDPAVGNINRHPEGAVAEIADWIKHTWDYSAPLRFEYVKEVIARGVTLRRADLWRKIRNKEPKPEGVSDRSWRTLARQLKSPATIEKSESCRRANASRINFGRTGPSGEVGVRQRLRRTLRRSPDPEEIQQEMLRDKGYGGYYRSERKNSNIMHGNEGAIEVFVEEGKSGRSGSLEPSEATHNKDNGHVRRRRNTVSAHMPSARKKGKEVVTQRVLAMTEDDISQHPLVQEMKQRLQALEERDSAVAVDVDNATMHLMSNAHDIGENDKAEGQTESQDEGNDVHSDDDGTVSSSRRRNERGKQI